MQHPVVTKYKITLIVNLYCYSQDEIIIIVYETKGIYLYYLWYLQINSNIGLRFSTLNDKHFIPNLIVNKLY